MSTVFSSERNPNLAPWSPPFRVALVSMPWASLEMPSLALSTLVPLAEDHADVESVDVIYGNVLFADYMAAFSAGSITSADHVEIAFGYYLAVGEWIFSSALHRDDTPAESTAYYRAATRKGADLAKAAFMYDAAPAFVRSLAETIGKGAYGIVGMTSTFDQNVPSLALAREIKIRYPHVLTLMGGANCDDVQGAALHRNFPEIDFVVRGEAELTLPALLTALSSADVESELSRIPGLCWRRDDGRSTVNPPTPKPVSMDEIPTPDYRAYFRAFAASDSCRDLTPKIVLEGGRGCWWGQKHHCTFCGLNGSLMAFRSKESARVMAELEAALQEHQVLDVLFADNILDMKYIRELFPMLAERDWDLQVFFEVKSNLRSEQVARLADARVTQVQPGIESLSTHVLGLMRKGVTAWQNVRLLRDCATYDIYAGWNWLYGFPGETAEDYLSVLRQVPRLTHLTPPEGVYRIVLTRFSPYFSDPSLGLTNRGAPPLLTSVYRLAEAEMREITYMFESEAAGIDAPVVKSLEEASKSWHDHHAQSALVAVEEGPALRFLDTRAGRRVEFTLEDAEASAYKAALAGAPLRVLRQRLADAGVRVPDIARTLNEWEERELVFCDGDHVVALATGLTEDHGSSQ